MTKSNVLLALAASLAISATSAYAVASDETPAEMKKEHHTKQGHKHEDAKKEHEEMKEEHHKKGHKHHKHAEEAK